MFFGRKEELMTIEEKISNNRFESFLIYGRRRIGKTELVREAIKKFKGTIIHYECKKSLYGDNISALNEALKEIFGINFNFSSFYDICDYIFTESKNKKIVFIIDEFPFLIEGNNVVISDLQRVIDKHKNDSLLKLIVLGSYMDVMKSLNDGTSPCYGRFTNIIDLKPFDYYDAAKFYSSYSDEDKVLMYSVFGGVAFFNSLIDENKTALENIINLIVNKNSILQLEIENFIFGEINKIPQCNSALELIGTGVNKYSDITNKLTAKNGNKISPDYLLKKLCDLELIEKVVPINDKTNKKKTFYVIKDNLLNFYYKYIYRNKTKNGIMNGLDFYNYFVKDNLETQYIPKMFENISKEFLIRASKKHYFEPVIFEIGTYFYDDAKSKKNVQLDIVTTDIAGYISYECKYTNSPVTFSIINEEEYQNKISLLGVYKLGFISKSGFVEGINKNLYNCFELKEFYSI